VTDVILVDAPELLVENAPVVSIIEVATSPETLLETATNNILQDQIISNVIVDSITNTVLIDGIVNTEILEVAKQGPAGPPGSSEEDTVYSKRVDFITDDLLYRAEALVGSLESASLWRIRKIVFGVDGDVTETWAAGNANFDKVWNDRLSYIYS